MNEIRKRSRFTVHAKALGAWAIVVASLLVSFAGPVLALGAP